MKNFIATLILFSLILLTCSSEENNAGAAGSAGQSGTNVAGSPHNTLILGCKQECEKGFFCSSTKKCIKEGTCASKEDCVAGNICDTKTSKCIIGGDCGSVNMEIKAISPNLMILLDRSCSMPLCTDYPDLIHGQECFNYNGINKWLKAVEAIDLLTENYRGKIYWGLSLFPDNEGDACIQGDPAILPGENNEDFIQNLLNEALDTSNENFPRDPCVTNIMGVMDQTSQMEFLEDQDRDSYVILLTDGKEAVCGSYTYNNNVTESLIEDMLSRGVKTFVIGFGTGVDKNSLNRFAIAGGVPNPDISSNNSYYQADDEEDLNKMLDDIVDGIIGCDYKLNEVPEDPTKLYVFINKEILDSAYQFEFNKEDNKIIFKGDACELIKSGNANIDVVFGCPKIPNPIK